MSKDAPSKELSHFIEENGMWFESMGLPRMAGKVYGWLLISDPPNQTAQEIATAVEGSKGSISTATRMLIQFGLIERFGVPGRRSAFFRLRPNGWVEWMQHEMVQIAAMRDLADKGQKMLKAKPKAQRQRLKEVSDLFGFIINNQSKFMDDVTAWVKKKEGKK